MRSRSGSAAGRMGIARHPWPTVNTRPPPLTAQRSFPVAKAGSMKLSITYLYTIFTYGYPPSVEDDFKAIADIQKMGFHYLEMEALGDAHGQGVWERRVDLKKCLDDHDV